MERPRIPIHLAGYCLYYCGFFRLRLPVVCGKPQTFPEVVLRNLRKYFQIAASMLNCRHRNRASYFHFVEPNNNSFRPTKGFGFAVPEEDPCDAFVHITTLQDAGIKELGEGAIISCHVVKGPKGALVTKVAEMIEQGVNPTPITFRVEVSDDEVLDTMTGTVKWYKPDKGFGFIENQY